MSGHYDYLDGVKDSSKKSLPAVGAKSHHVNRLDPLVEHDPVVARRGNNLCVACGKEPITHHKLGVGNKCYRQKTTNGGRRPPGSNGGAGRGRGAKKLISEEDRAAIVKRLKKFERPIDLAREYDVSTRTILAISKESRDPS